jgi:hypothetical protein
MAKKYKEIIEDLERAVNDIKSQGISIEPLNRAVDELKSHSDNIEAVENNIDAIKSEVITPIKVELEQNKKAGRFSVGGFYVGLFGLLVTAFSLLYTTFIPKENIPNKTDYNINDTLGSLKSIRNSLDEINYEIHGLNENYKPLKDEYLIERRENVKLLKGDSLDISIEADIPSEELINGNYYPMASLSFLIGGKKLGEKSLKEKIKLISKNNISHYYSHWNTYWMTESDIFIIMNKYQFQIKRIYRTDTKILTVADDKDAVLIKRIK